MNTKEEFDLLYACLNNQEEVKYIVNHKDRIDKITKMFQEFNLGPKFEKYKETNLYTCYCFLFNEDVPLKKIIHYNDDVRMHVMSKDPVRIGLSYDRRTVGIEVPNEYKNKLGLGELLDIDDVSSMNTDKKSMFFPVGKNILESVVFENLCTSNGMIVTGDKSTGKSTFIKSMIMSLSMLYSPSDLSIVIADVEGKEYRKFNKLPHLKYGRVLLGCEDLMDSIDLLNNEIEVRLETFKAQGVKNISEYIEKTGEVMPRVVYCIDNYSDLCVQADESFIKKLTQIISIGKSVGVYFVLASKEISFDAFTSDLIHLLPSRVVFKTKDCHNSMMVLNCDDAVMLVKGGDCLYRSINEDEMQRIQTPYISDKEIEDVSYLFTKKYTLNKNSEKSEESINDTIDSKNVEISTEAQFFLSVLRYTAEKGYIAISTVQRHFQTGYARAGRIIDKLEEAGYITRNETTKKWISKITKDEFIEKFGDINFEENSNIVVKGEKVDDKKKERDPLFTDAEFLKVLEFAVKEGKISNSIIQRRFSFYYNKACAIMEKLEDLEYIEKADPNHYSSNRKVLIKMDELKKQFYENYNATSNKDDNDMFEKVHSGDILNFIKNSNESGESLLNSTLQNKDMDKGLQLCVIELVKIVLRNKDCNPDILFRIIKNKVDVMVKGDDPENKLDLYSYLIIEVSENNNRKILFECLDKIRGE